MGGDMIDLGIINLKYIDALLNEGTKLCLAKDLLSSDFFPFHSSMPDSNIG